MTFRTRVSLVVIGVIIFAIAAPIAILAARGYKYDPASHKLIKTGTLIVKTDPKGAQIFLNGKKTGTSQLTERFLLPGDYVIEIKKDSYQTWKKNIIIRAQQVTYLIGTGSDYTPLFLASPIPSQASTSTHDFYLTSQSKIDFLSRGQAWQLAEYDPATAKQNDLIDFNTNFSTPKIIQEQNGQFLISDQEKFLYASVGNPTPVPITLKEAKLAGDQGIIAGIDDKNQLIRWNLRSNTKTILQQGTINFAVAANNDIFSITSGSTGNLWQISTGQQPKIVARDLPLFSSGKIIISPTRQLFVVLDGTLYSTESPVQKINSNVTSAQWSVDANGLLYGNANELWIFDPQASEQNKLLTRSSESLGTAFYNTYTGYVFTATGNEIKAMELDSSGQPNFYTLTRTKTANVKFAIDGTGTEIYYLDGNDLTTLKIR